MRRIHLSAFTGIYSSSKAFGQNENLFGECENVKNVSLVEASSLDNLLRSL
jgi:hypothetical protein